MGRRLRSTFLVGVVVGIVLALIRARRADRSTRPSLGVAPAALGTPAVDRAPAAATVPAPEAAAPDPALPRTGSGSDRAEPAPAAPVDQEVAPAPGTASAEEPEPPAEVDATVPATSSSPTWVGPVDGGCPEGYPVKAKEASRIFHVPGGLSYARTRPDRCYPDAASAEADGFRPAKR